MGILIRRSDERGHFDHGWLDTYHTFSFADYFDASQMGFRALRVINEDRVEAGEGFPTHGHRDMEIITYVLEGSLEHRDSLGNGSVIKPGEVQRMTAGTGVRHSEKNPSRTEPVHLLQIWILPERPGLTPGYEQKNFSKKDLTDRLCLVASNENGKAVKVHQDVRLYASSISAGSEVEASLKKGRHAWLQVARGQVKLNGAQRLKAGDGAAISDETSLSIRADAPSEILLFDLA